MYFLSSAVQACPPRKPAHRPRSSSYCVPASGSTATPRYRVPIVLQLGVCFEGNPPPVPSDSLPVFFAAFGFRARVLPRVTRECQMCVLA